MKEFGARLVLKDKMGDALKKNAKQQQQFTKQINNTKKAVQSLGKTKANPVLTVKDKITSHVSKIGSKLKAVGSMVAKPFVGVKDEASGKLSGIESMIKKLAAGVTIVAAIQLVGAGLGASLTEGGALQQSIGGVETLFKDNASKVIEDANKAFQTAGISANTYMEQVTSFSASLLQSLGGDTAKAAEVSNMAIVDMADNANKFGTDMARIQDAYQGFAKQNYTMLDNLKLGYGGTKEEMQRLLSDAEKLTGVKYDINNLSDVYNAIHAIQENMGVTGTTAKEASATFTGSLSAMKAAASNLLGQLSIGNGEAVAKAMGDLVKTTGTFLFDNLIPMVQTIFRNLPTAIGTAVSEIAPKIKSCVVPLVTSIKDGIFNALESIGLDSGILDKISGMLSFDNINLGGAMDIFNQFKDTIIRAANVVLSMIPSVISMIQTVAPVVMSVVGVILTIINGLIAVIEKIAPIVMAVITTVISVVSKLVSAFVSAFNFLSPFISGIWNVICSIFSGAYNTISGIINVFVSVFNRLRSAVSSVFNAIRSVVSSVCNAVGSVISSVSNKISSVVNKISAAASKVKSFASSVGGALGFAYGKDRVPYNNYPALLHQGERVLTRVEADRYDEIMAGKTRNVPNRAMGTGVIPKDNTLINAHQGEKLLTKQETNQQKSLGSVVFNKIADTLVIREEADIDKITNQLVKKMEKIATNMA